MSQYPLPSSLLPAALKKRCIEAVRLGAQWHKANQVRHAWPHWTADAGRFNSSFNLRHPENPPMKSICWNTARGAQACLSTYKLTGDADALETARFALEYDKSCQIFSPEYARHRGACFEETPQSDHIAARDTVETLQGFINYYAITKDPVALERALAAADWFTGLYLERKLYPNGYIWIKDNDRGSVNNDFSRIMFASAAMAFLQLDALTGTPRYAEKVPDVMDWVIENSLEKDGAMKIHDGTDVGHHATSSGPLAGCFTNDDGTGVAIIAAARVTGLAKYREAAERYGRWWLRLNQMPATHASIPAGLLLLLDFYRYTGNKAYVEKSAAYIEKVLELQHSEPARALAHGGFKGHDMTGKREHDYFMNTPGDEIISHRTTMYAMFALAKAAAENDKEWNLAYSAFGW
ncbi:MAG: hypothetical protein V1913_03265 [Fibrobacterota bacterium]